MPNEDKTTSISMADGSPVLSVQDSDLSSRKSAVVLRRAVEGFIPCEVDFSNVLSMSDGFADEFFGVLIAKYGAAWFKEKVTVKGLLPDLRARALLVVDRRCNGVC